MKTHPYHVIKASLVARIEARQLLPGQRVPSENQLKEEFSVSRMTARKALTELVEAGILQRSQGLGTFVADLRLKSSMMAVNNIAEEVEFRSNTYSCDVLTLDTVSAKYPETLLLQVDENEKLFHSIIVHKENGLPIQYEERYVNAGLIPEYDKQDFLRETPNSYLRRVAPLTEADHTIEAVVVDDRIARYLCIEQQEPCLKITRLTSSVSGMVNLAYLTHPGSRYRLGGHLYFPEKKED